jgi:hypothetical protein
MEDLRYQGYRQPASEETFQCQDKKQKDRWGVPISRPTLLILMVGLLIFCQRVQAVELTLLFSNDMRGVIDPCPT